MLADMSFADILVLLPVVKSQNGSKPSGFFVMGHIRPINSSTIYLQDIVGQTFTPKERPLAVQTFMSGQISDGGILMADKSHWMRTLTVPINFSGEIIGILVREYHPTETRMAGQLETAYFSAFRKLAKMVADGSYPFPEETINHDHPPRVGDGLMILDASKKVEYLTPNAHSAFSRLGLTETPTGMHIDDFGLELSGIDSAYKSCSPRTFEIDTEEHTVAIKCLPLLDGRQISGALVLLRDITELRSRDRLLMTKDATIAEIHHRVKNNLQTISSLLQLQSRRLSAPEAQSAILESARRIRSIAVVHDILARDLTEQVRYEEIVNTLIAEMKEALVSSEVPIRVNISGAAGLLPSAVASTLALIMSELLQNTFEHAFSNGFEAQKAEAQVKIDFKRTDAALEVLISDNGVGLSADFSIEDNPGLGLKIVTTLLTADLRGTIQMLNPKKGTSIRLLIPTSEPNWQN